jgi:hypothetical protein
MRKIYSLLSFVFVTCGLCFSAFASEGDSSTVGSTPGNKFGHHYSLGLNKDSSARKKVNFARVGTEDWDDKGISIYFGGFMNFSTRYRNIKTKDWPIRPKSIDIPYNGAALISLNMNMQIAPGFNTVMVLGLSPRFNGSLDPDSARERSGGNGVFSAQANYKTRYAMIKVAAGSLVTGMSNLFVSGAGNAGRLSPFYRVPWDGTVINGGAWMAAENSIFRYGSGNANLDPFFTNGGRTRGFVLQASQMPWNLGLNMGYGVDPQTFTNTFVYVDPNLYNLEPGKKTFGTRLYKTAGTNIFGLNLIIHNGHWQNVSNDLRESQYMWSGDVFLRLSDYYTIVAEAGATAFTNPYGKWDPDSAFSKFFGKNLLSDPTLRDEYSSGISYLGKVNIQVDERKFGLPIQVGLYSLGPHYVNINSATFNTFTWNTSSKYVGVGQGWDYDMRRGVITDVGQTANNRKAAEMNTSIGKGKFRVNMGSQVSQEIEKESSAKLNQVMFSHKLNVFSTSSFQPWQASGGPYSTLLSTYFQLQEKVSITDTVIDYRKTFNSVSIDARYKTTLFGKDILLENYINYQSASDHFSPLPFVTNTAFVRVFFNELMCYYRLKKNVTLVGLLAVQKAVANNRTRLSPETGKPMDQTAYGIGGGVDFDIDSTKGLYLRAQWNSHQDKNFIRDRYTLFETTVDFKVYF